MGFFVFIVFVVCAVYVQNRGRVQHVKLSRKLTDHSNVLAPLNCLFYAFSTLGNRPFFHVDEFKDLAIIQANWQKIRDEALSLNSEQAIKASADLDDLGFNSFFKTGWKRFYLKWYGVNLQSAQRRCPYTVELLNQIPSVKGAMFAMLPPGARLVKHRDPFAGSLRYHLGLVTPNDDSCYIDVDGERYSWRDGEAVIFDETYIHYAENQTDQNRIILFLDIKRPVTVAFIDWINGMFSSAVMSATATKNEDGDKVGVLNKLFANIYALRQVGKRVKAFSEPLYYALQVLIYCLIVKWLFF